MRSVWLLVIRDLQHNKRRNLLLAVGCILSSAFIIAVILSGVGAISGLSEYNRQVYGGHQFLALNVDAQHAENIGQLDGLEQCGQIKVLGYFKNSESLYADNIPLGAADSTALDLGNIRLTSGRFPKEAGEVAVEQSVLDRMKSDASIGDAIELPVFRADGKGGFSPNTVTQTFVITGILRDYSRVWTRALTLSSPSVELPGILTILPEGEVFNRDFLLKFKGEFSQQQQMFQAQNSIDTLLKPENITFNKFSHPIQEMQRGINQKSDLYLGAGTVAAVVLVCMVSCIQMVSSISISMRSQIKQLLMVKAIGSSDGYLFAVSLLKILMIVFISLPIGFLLGAGISIGLNSLLSNFLGVTIAFSPHVIWFAAAALLMVFTAVVATGFAHRAVTSKTSLSSFDKAKSARRKMPSKSTHRKSMFQVFIRPNLPAVVQLTSVLALALLLVYPVQFIQNIYVGHFYKQLEYDTTLYLTGGSRTGALQMERNLGNAFSLEDLARIESTPGIKDLTYYSQIPSAQIMVEDALLFDELSGYCVGDTGVSWVEEMESPDGSVDLVERDKQYYGYDADVDFVPCDINAFKEEDLQKLAPFFTSGQLDIEKLKNGSGVLAVRQESNPSEYPYQPGDSVQLTKLAVTEESENYYAKPDESERYDLNAEISGIITIGKEDRKALGLSSASFTFLTTPQALREIGYPVTIQKICLNYETGADVPKIEENLKKMVRLYPETAIESRYEQNLSALHFKRLVNTVGLGFSALIGLLAMFILYNSSSSFIEFNKKTIALMRIIGETDQSIKKVFYFQVFLIACSSCMLSILLCCIVGAILNYFVGLFGLLLIVLISLSLFLIGILAINIPVRKILKGDEIHILLE